MPTKSSSEEKVTPPMLSVKDLYVHFPVSRGLNPFTKKKSVKAVDGISFDLAKEETLALVGESGSGKTTTGRVIARLTRPTGGSAEFEGVDVLKLNGGELKNYRKRVQMMFQDPYESLNPRAAVVDQVGLPLVVFGMVKTRQQKQDAVSSLLDKVGLGHEDVLYKYPHQLSGGERQRVSIARAIATNPELVVADEPVSMLDVSVRAGVLNLMQGLATTYHLSYLFITHDLSVVKYMARRMAVMYLGKVFELGLATDIMSKPIHPYTQLLLEATPKIGPKSVGRVEASGEIPSSIDVPPGCRFHPRCPYATEICKSEIPPLRNMTGTLLVACHWAEKFA
jgi:oligopeptide/dipeptide ABC transporter ATP-binding protein